MFQTQQLNNFSSFNNRRGGGMNRGGYNNGGQQRDNRGGRSYDDNSFRRDSNFNSGQRGGARNYNNCECFLA